MSFDLECAELIQRHLQEQGKNITIEAILSNPRYKRVWAWWNALAYFKERNHFTSLEEAPEGLPWITIVSEELMQDYTWENGYVLVQEMTRETCKKIYGEG